MLRITIEATEGNQNYVIVPDQRLGDMLFCNTGVFRIDVSFPGSSQDAMISALRAIADSLEEACHNADHPLSSSLIPD